ncbi:hypothetical protein Vafri_3159, partial [Volvox africanus]
HCSQQPQQLDTGLGTLRARSSIDGGGNRGLCKPMALTSPIAGNYDGPVDDITGNRRVGTKVGPRAASMQSMPGPFLVGGVASREMPFCSSPHSSRAADQQGLTNIPRAASRYSRVFTFASSLRNTPAVLQQAAAAGSMCSVNSINPLTSSGRVLMAVSNNHGNIQRLSLTHITHMIGATAGGSTSAGDANVTMDGMITATAGVLDSAVHH